MDRGDDDPNPLHQQIASAIKAVVDAGAPCATSSMATAIFRRPCFTRQSGMILLAEEERLGLYGREVLIGAWRHAVHR